MTTIRETLGVACPYVRARQYLHDELSEACKSASPHVLRLAAPVPATEIELQKTVLVRYACGKDPMHFDEPWIVNWEPERGGVYPSFSGVLTVRADEDYTGAILELSGAYAPPLGAAGAVFDLTLGRKIASATMQALLGSIAGDMVEKYQREEAAKTNAL
jgi:hypothetical protein